MPEHRRQWPIQVSRSSFCLACATLPFASITRIVRNFRIQNTCRPAPQRCSRDRTGPGDEAFIATAIAMNTGRDSTIRSEARIRSVALLATEQFTFRACSVRSILSAGQVSLNDSEVSICSVGTRRRDAPNLTINSALYLRTSRLAAADPMAVCRRSCLKSAGLPGGRRANRRATPSKHA
jgi:hypothetical protein